MPLQWRALEEAAQKWEAAGLRPIPTLSKLLQRHRTIKDELRKGLQYSVDLSEVARRVVAGEISLKEAVIEHAALAEANAPVAVSNSMSRIRVIADSVEVEFRRRFVEEMAEVDVEGLWRKAEQETAAAINKKSPLIEGLASADEAIERGPKAAAAWVEVKELRERMDRLADCYEACIRAGLIAYRNRERAESAA